MFLGMHGDGCTDTNWVGEKRRNRGHQKVQIVKQVYLNLQSIGLVSKKSRLKGGSWKPGNRGLGVCRKSPLPPLGKLEFRKDERHSTLECVSLEQ